MMIQYIPDTISGYHVRLDGKLVGRIRKVKGGYQYFPRGYDKGGEITTLENLKYILEIGSETERV